MYKKSLRREDVEKAVNEAVQKLVVKDETVNVAEKIFDDMIKEQEKLWLERNKNKLVTIKDLEKELGRTKDGFISTVNDELKKELENRWSDLNIKKQKLQLELAGQ